MKSTSMHHIDSNLIIILTFIVALFTVRRYFRWKRSQLWHETARVALEKGQPLPKNLLDRDRRLDMRSDVGVSLIWIAVGAALYCSLPDGPAYRVWATVPGFIGIACLLFNLFSFFQSDRSSDPKDRDPSDQK
jgi:hypothetical protein